LSRCLNVVGEETDVHSLFVDISELVQRDARTGIQRVTRGILNELFHVIPDGYKIVPVYATTQRLGYRRAAAQDGFYMATEDDDVIDPRPGDIFLGLDLQHHVLKAQHEYLTRLRRYGVRVYFVVYDLLPIQLPHCFPQEAEGGHRQWLEEVCGYDGALCISQSVGRALQSWLTTAPVERLRPFHIHWFHLGADVENTSPTRGIPEHGHEDLLRLKQGVTFLAVGTVEPRKGYVQLLAAFEQLWSAGQEVNLVIVGKRGWMMESFWEKLHAHEQNHRRLFWFEGVSDEYLELLYSAASCLINSSRGEGFGLPLIEAAQHHLPIVARDLPVFREVAGDAAFYFANDESAQGLAQAVDSWLDLYRRQQHPRSDHLSAQTWRQSARQVVEVLLNGENEINS